MINDSFDLVLRAIGNPDLAPGMRRHSESPYFDMYEIQLPLPEFSGVPREWLFSVLNKDRFLKAGSNRTSALEDAHSLISSNEYRNSLMILISDVPTAHLADEFGNHPRDVFCLDYAEIPHARDYRTQPRLAPFILSIRRRLSIN